MSIYAVNTHIFKSNVAKYFQSKPHYILKISTALQSHFATLNRFERGRKKVLHFILSFDVSNTQKCRRKETFKSEKSTGKKLKQTCSMMADEKNGRATCMPIMHREPEIQYGGRKSPINCVFVKFFEHFCLYFYFSQKYLLEKSIDR
jgi:hypothetical protein